MSELFNRNLKPGDFIELPVPPIYDIYLYGASDDCMEVKTSWNKGAESYVGIQIDNVRVHYVYDGDWGIWLEGDIPEGWVIRSIEANWADEARHKPHAGQFIHIRVPAPVTIVELEDGE